MRLHSDSFDPGEPIASAFAFGMPGDDGPFATAGNRNPHLAWSEVPAAARGLVLVCVDPDAPTRPDTVNREDREVPVDQPRAHFYHWVMTGLPAAAGEIAAGSCSDGVTLRGKASPAGPSGTRQGANDYTGWFSGDADMDGEYRGYDGPCPPWNDALEHRYFFRLFALDIARPDLPDGFTGGDLMRAIQGHVIAEACVMGTYSMRRRG